MMQQQDFIKRATEIKTKLEEMKFTALTYECFFCNTPRFGKLVKPARELQARMARQIDEIKEILNRFDLPYPPRVSEAEMDNSMKYYEEYLRGYANNLYELTREVPPEHKKKYDLK